jgi:hypothetical protein
MGSNRIYTGLIQPAKERNGGAVQSGLKANEGTGRDQMERELILRPNGSTSRKTEEIATRLDDALCVSI